MKHTLLALVIIATLFSCKKKDTTPSTNNTITPPNTQSAYYIQGTVKGSVIKADMIPTGQADSTYTYYQASTPLVSMTKYVNFSPTNFQSWSLAFYYDLDAITVPVTYNGSIDQLVLSYSPPGGITYPYVNDPADSTTILTLTSKAGDILEGTFSGTLMSPTDTIIVTNGAFKVKVVRK